MGRPAFVAARYGTSFFIEMLMTVAAIWAVLIGATKEAAAAAYAWRNLSTLRPPLAHSVGRLQVHRSLRCAAGVTTFIQADLSAPDCRAWQYASG